MRPDDQAFLEATREITASLDHVPSPTALLDESGTIRWQNKSSLALRGKRVGSDFDAFLAPETRSDARSFFERILNNDEPAELSAVVLNAQGDYVELRGRWCAVPTR